MFFYDIFSHLGTFEVKFIGPLYRFLIIERVILLNARLGCLRNSVNAEFRTFFHFRTFCMRIGISKNLCFEILLKFLIRKILGFLHRPITEIMYTEFRTRKSTKFRGIMTEFRAIKQRKIPWNSAEVKSLPNKITYSAEFQKVTSVNTLC
jgi:hypothetical protein